MYRKRKRKKKKFSTFYAFILFEPARAEIKSDLKMYNCTEKWL